MKKDFIEAFSYKIKKIKDFNNLLKKKKIKKFYATEILM